MKKTAVPTRRARNRVSIKNRWFGIGDLRRKPVSRSPDLPPKPGFYQKSLVWNQRSQQETKVIGRRDTKAQLPITNYQLPITNDSRKN